jgi:hypothetical protein
MRHQSHTQRKPGLAQGDVNFLHQKNEKTTVKSWLSLALKDSEALR